MYDNKYFYCHTEYDHIQKLLEWIFEEVISAGGDGDALWYHQYYHIDDVLLILKKVNEKYNWNITIGPKCLGVNSYQEGFMISNDENHYLTAPLWQQVLIKY